MEVRTIKKVSKLLILILVGVLVNTSSIITYAISPTEAIETHEKDIIASARKTGVWASVTAAQLMLESGNPMSKLATEGNNFFGIKWADVHSKRYPGATGVEYSTKEDYGNGLVTVNAKFTHFPTPKDGITEHSIIWWNGNYYPELKILNNLDSSMDEFLREMANGPYATDPNYYKKLRKIIDDNNLEELDKKAFPEGRQFCGFGDKTVGQYKYPDDEFNDGGNVATIQQIDGKNYVIVKEEDLIGMYPESFLTEGAFEVVLPDVNSLTAREKFEVAGLRDNINEANDWNLYDALRVFSVFCGLCLMMYAVLIGVAYIFDRSNTFLDFSMISVLSLGKLHYSEDEDDVTNKHLINKYHLIRIEVSLWLVGLFLVGGGIFNLIAKILYMGSTLWKSIF